MAQEKNVIKKDNLSDNIYFLQDGDTISVVNTIKHNSFKKFFNQLEISQGEPSKGTIKFKTREISDFINNFKNYTEINPKNNQTNSVHISINTDIQMNEFVVVNYDLLFTSPKGWKVGHKSFILIFDKSGQLIFEHQNDEGIGYPTISPNRKYLAYTYGYEDEGGVFINSGLRVMNINKEELAFEKSGHFRLVSFSGKDFTYVRESIENGTKTKYTIIHSADQKIYSKVFGPDDLKFLQNYSSEGFIFKNKANESWVEKYKDSFESQDL